MTDRRIDPTSRMGFALIVAARNGRTAVVRVLLDDPRIDAGSLDSAALVAAASNGHEDVVTMLLAVAAVDPTAKDFAALIGAAAGGHTDVVRRLIGDPRVVPSAALRMQAVDRAVWGGHTDIVCLLLSQFETSDALDKPDHRKQMHRWLMHAAETGNAAIIQALLAFPWLDPTALENAPLRTAAAAGQAAAVAVLLADPRIDPCARDNEPVFAAAMRGHVDVVHVLLADPRVDPTARGQGPILAAAGSRHAATVAELLADPRAHREATPGAQSEFYGSVLRDKPFAAAVLLANPLAPLAIAADLPPAVVPEVSKGFEIAELLFTHTWRRRAHVVTARVRAFEED